MRTLSQISMANYFGVVKPNLTNREQWVLEAIEELAACYRLIALINDILEDYQP